MTVLRRWAGNSALSLASVAACLGFLEVGARLLVEAAARRADAAPPEPISAYHAQLGWFHVPGAERRIVRPEFDVGLRFNSLGLRGPERGHAVPEGVTRTLVLGDSFAEGYYAEDHETAAAVLERLLQACGPHQVVNAGVQGYSTDQEYLLYLHEGRRYGARVVLLLFYSNDLRFNASPRGPGGEAKPYFELSADGTLVRRHDPVPEPPPDAVSRARPGAHRPAAWHGSMALRLLSNRTVDAAPGLHAALARAGLVEPVSRDAPIELWPYGPGHAREVEEMWRRTTALLAALRDAVAADGATLALLYVPVRFEIDAEAWRLTRERYAMGPRWDPDRVHDRLAATARELGIALADPRPALRRALQAGRAPYYTRDSHWNALGNQLAAHAAEPLVRDLLGCPR